MAAFWLPRASVSEPMTTYTTDVYDGPAAIEMDDGNGGYEVDCRYFVEQELVHLGIGTDVSVGEKRWSGFFTTTDPIGQPGDGTLVLPDGRSARITVTSIERDVGGVFTGTSEPPG